MIRNAQFNKRTHIAMEFTNLTFINVSFKNTIPIPLYCTHFCRGICLNNDFEQLADYPE